MYLSDTPGPLPKRARKGHCPVSESTAKVVYIFAVVSRTGVVSAPEFSVSRAESRTDVFVYFLACARKGHCPVPESYSVHISPERR